MKMARKFAISVKPVRNSKISSILTIKNSVISFGYNERRSHPFQLKYGKNIESIYLHAETSAIYNSLRFLEIEDLKKATLYIYRIKKSDKKEWITGNAYPCAGCKKCIATFSIKKIIYTTDENDIYNIL